MRAGPAKPLAPAAADAIMRQPDMHPKTNTRSLGGPAAAGFPWRLLIYGAVLVWLLADLFWLGGPLREWVDNRLPHSPASRERAMQQGWVALVNGVPVLREDVDRAVERRLILSGQDWEQLGAEARRLERIRALEQVVRERLLITYSQLSPIRAPDDEQAIVAELARWKQLPAVEPAPAAELEWLARREWRMARWVESRIAPSLPVTDDEVRAWLEQHEDAMQLPERYLVRHLHLSRQDPAADQPRPELEEIDRALGEIGAAPPDESDPSAPSDRSASTPAPAQPGPAEWDRLVARWCEDPVTAERGGALGWISADRVPEDFMAAVREAAERPGEVSGPHATALGWHWLVVDDQRPPRPATWDEVAGEIRAHLETRRRQQAVDGLIEAAKNRAKIFYYMEVLLAD